MDDELNIIIGLILESDGEQLAKAYEAAVSNMVKNTEGATKKAATKQEQDANRARAKAQEEGAREALRGLQRSMKEQASTSRELNKQELVAFRFYLNQRLKALDQAFKEIRNNSRKNYSIELQEQRQQAAKELNATKASERDQQRVKRKADTDDSLAKRTAAAKDLLNQKAAAGRLAAATRQAEAKINDARRTAEAKRKEAARDASRQVALNDRKAEFDRTQAAREGAAERVRVGREESAQRLKATAAANSQRLQSERANAARELEVTRAAGRSQYVAEQASEARRTARTRFFLRGLTSTYEAGLRGTQNVVSSFLRRRERDQETSDRRATASTRTAISQQTSVIRQQLETQNSTYSRAAQRRLATIERNAAAETKVITGAAVRQAEATANIQRQASSGVLGAATGGRLGAGGLLGLLAGAGGGRYTYDVLADFQSIETTFKGIFNEVNGNAPRTEQFLDDLADFAKKTPFTLRSLAEYSQKFFANGLVDPAAADATAQLTDKLLKLADAASATGKSTDQINGAVLGLTQISASGRLSLEDLRQVTEGIGIRLGDVAKELGLTTGELFENLSKGSVSAEAGLAAIFSAMTKIPGAAGAASRQSANLRGAFSNLQDVIDSLIVKYLTPLGAKLAVTVSGIADFIAKLSEGKGVYKIIRDGITGIAIALGAVLAVKGAVQVISLFNSALGLLVANPGVALFFGIAATATALYKNVPGITAFFDSLVSGTENWIRAGYRFGEPITGLSTIVTLQSSFGAAARTIKDGLADIGGGIRTLVTGGGTGELVEALRTLRDNLGEILTPGKDVLVKGLRTAIDAAVSFLNTEALPRLATARLDTGAFLLTALGLSGGGGGIVSRVLRRAIGKVFVGAFSDLSSAEGAAELGSQLNDTIEKAVEYVRSTGVNVGRFFTGLFTGDPGDEAASKLGATVRKLVELGIAKIGDVAAPLVAALGAVGSAIGDFFTKFVLPKLIEFPRILGRFLSRTLFSEGFLKALTLAAAGIAGAAAVIAFQFVRGFAEGLYERKGDIAAVLSDILKFAVGAIIGSGNPFIILGSVIVAAIAGAKVLGAFKSLRDQARVFTTGFQGDLKKTQAEARKLGEVKTGVTGPGARAGNAGLAIANIGDPLIRNALRVESAFRKVTANINGTLLPSVAKGFDTVGGRVEAFGTKLLGMEGKYRDSTGRLQNVTGGFAKDTTKNLGAVRTAVGRAAQTTGVFLQNIPRSAKLAYDKLASSARTGYQKATAAASDAFNSLRALGAKQEDGTRAQISGTTAAVSAAAGVISGYFLGMSDSAESAAIGIVASVTSIAGAFATGGPIVGGLAVVATAIGAIVGKVTNENRKAKEEAAQVAAETKEVTDRIAKSYRDTFANLGSTGPAARAQAAINAIKVSLEDGADGAEEFRERFGGSVRAASEAAAGGEEAFKRYGKSLVDAKVTELLRGDKDALKGFAKEYGAAVDSTLTNSDALNSALGQIGLDQLDTFERLRGELADGTITIDQFTKSIQFLGIDAKTASDLTKDFTGSLRDLLESSSGGVFLEGLAGQIKSAIEDQQTFAEVAAEAQRQLDLSSPIVDRIASAYGRVKDAIAKVADSLRTYLDLQNGGQLTLAQGRINLLQGASSFGEIDGSTTLGQSQREVAVLEAQRSFADQIAQLAKESSGNVDVLKLKVAEYVSQLRDGATPAQQDFLDLVTTLPPDTVLNQLVTQSQPAITSVNELKQQISDYIALLDPNSPLAVKLDTGTADEKAAGLLEVINNLGNEKPEVKAALNDKEFQETLANAKLDITDFTATEKAVTLVANVKAGTGYEQLLEILNATPGVIPTEHGGLIGAARPNDPTPQGGVLPGSTNVPRGRSLPATAPTNEGGFPAPGSIVPTGGDAPIVVHITETTSPRLTALETVRKVRAGQHLGGRTLTPRRPVTTGG